MILGCAGGDAQKMVRNAGLLLERGTNYSIYLRNMDLQESLKSQVKIVSKLLGFKRALHID